MKKMLGVFVLGIFLFSMIGIVSAGPVEAIQDFAEGAYSLLEPVLKIVVGETASVTDKNADLFLVKILFLIIIFSIVWKGLERISFFEETTWMLWVVSVGVSVLSVRWFGGNDLVQTILLPYSALGVTLTAGLPFILYFFIVKDFKTTMRKVSWIFFIVVFIGLWVVRSGDDINASVKLGGFAYIYLATAGLALVVLLADKTIQRTIKKSQADATRELAEARTRTRLTEERNALEEKKIAGTVSKNDYTVQDHHIRKQEKKYGLI